MEIRKRIKFVNNCYAGFLQTQYYQTYADYLVKFLLAYQEQGLEIYGISTGNEPMDVFFPFFHLSSMGWTPRTVATWIANNLGPSIAASQSNQTKILIIDDQRINFPWYADQIFENELAKNYTAIIAVHFYWDKFTSASVLSVTHERHPDKDILMTEACVGKLLRNTMPKIDSTISLSTFMLIILFCFDTPGNGLPKNENVLLGDWERGERYISDIIENLNNWVSGWVEWNLALDQSGGPNWIQNNVDASIIVNPDADEFYKQPTYYALAHFSKFITLGSRIIGTTTSGTVSHVAVVTPQEEIVVVLYNPWVEITIKLQVSKMRIFMTKVSSKYQTFFITAKMTAKLSR